MRNKTRFIALAFLFVLSASTATASVVAGRPVHEKGDNLTPEQRVRIESFQRRVVEIKAMDRSSLTKAERKDIKKELKEMNKEARAIQGKGVYLSVGAIIIIVLLLILLL